jgi:hypothetical protein
VPAGSKSIKNNGGVKMHYGLCLTIPKDKELQILSKIKVGNRNQYRDKNKDLVLFYHYNDNKIL